MLQLKRLEHADVKWAFRSVRISPVISVKDLLKKVDMILIMSVHPGFGGQAFIPESLDKIRELKAMIDAEGLRVDIQVDGGIYTHNVEEVIEQEPM